MQYFSDILEYIPASITIDNTIRKKQLYIAFKNYIQKNNLENEKEFFVSLSGGVDSMVLAFILHLWNQYSNENNAQIKCLHINYNNREETGREEEFLRIWCKFHQFSLLVLNFGDFQRDKVARNEYEKETRNRRYQFYREHTDKIFIGHHANDVAENVFCNVMKGRNILDLSVISERNTIMGVSIMRPFRDFPKKEILHFAHSYSIPYFKDTTPDWSNRGKLRRRIFTSIEDQFGSGTQHSLYEFAQQSDQLQQIFNKMILNPYLEKILRGKYGFCLLLNGMEEMPPIFWNAIFMNIFHSIGVSMPKRKNIDNLVEKISRNYVGQITFKENYLTHLLTIHEHYCLLILSGSYLDNFKNLKEKDYMLAQDLKTSGIHFKCEDDHPVQLQKVGGFLEGELITSKKIEDHDKIFSITGKKKEGVFSMGPVLHKFGTSLGRL